MKKIVLAILTLLSLSGCDTASIDGLIVIDSHSHPEMHRREDNIPPAHAPAYGRRAQHRMEKYRYYPDVYVYYSPVEHMYFYLSNNNWRMSAMLPFSLRADLGDYVTIEADSNRPYNEFSKHKKLYKSKRRNKKQDHYGKHYGHDKDKKHDKYDDRDD